MNIKYLFYAVTFAAALSWQSGGHAEDLPGNGADKMQGVSKGNPPSETPSGTKPADPASPGESAAKPAEPGNAGKPGTAQPSEPVKNGPPDETPSGTKPAEPAAPGENPATPAEPGKGGKPEDAGKGAKPKRTRPDRGGKSGGKSGVTPPSPQGGAAAGAAALGVIIGGDKKEEMREPKKEPVKKTEVSSGTVDAAAPAAAPVFSEGPGPKIAIFDLEGEGGADFAGLVAKALGPRLKVYGREELAARNYPPASINRLSARKIAAELGVDYLLTGKINKKTGTLSIVSLLLRDGATGDTKLTDNYTIRSGADLAASAETAAGKIEQGTKP